MNITRGLLDHGGVGPPIVLLHGLMGSGSTWFHHVPWLTNYGHVFTFDAAFHQNDTAAEQELLTQIAHKNPDALEKIRNERFVADIAEILHWIDLGPATLIGHSMGALHAWCTASTYPELVSSLVVEDMVPEFPGQTNEGWFEHFQSWPRPFTSREHATEILGDIAGNYFWTSFEQGYPHGSYEIWCAIAASWGETDFWSEWNNVTQPTLLIQGEKGIDIYNLMSTMAHNPAVQCFAVVPGVGHIIHDENTYFYRGLVEAFLAGLEHPDP